MSATGNPAPGPTTAPPLSPAVQMALGVGLLACAVAMVYLWYDTRRAQAELNELRRQDVEAATAEYARIVRDLRAGSDGVADRAEKNQQEMSKLLESQQSTVELSGPRGVVNWAIAAVAVVAGGLQLAAGLRRRSGGAPRPRV